MTRRNSTTTDKVRAVFLAALMVVSVFGGTVTLAGSAAATANSSSFAGNVYADGEEATISITDTSKAGNEELVVTVESVEVDGESDQETVVLENTDEDSVTFEGSIETKVVSSPDDFESDNGLIEGFAGSEINLADADYDASAVLDAKAGGPSITDADVVGMRDGNTVVRVDFSEPVHGLEPMDFEFTGSGEVTQVTPGTAQDGYVELTFDREIQTGDEDSELVVESGSYWDLAGIENTGTSEYVDSVELQLDEGMNFVSAPFETGGVGFDAMAEKGLLDNVDVVWAYDQSSPGDGYWVSYDPDAEENELEWFKGGQGYVFVADEPTEIDVRSYTKFADNDDSDNIPAVPQTEQIEPGWNLVGHYHEGRMSVDTAFGFGYDQDVGVLGQSDDGSMQYVGEADIGESYWVFTRDYGLYTPNKGDGGSSTADMTLTLDSVEITNDDDDGYAENGETVEVTYTASDGDGLYSLMVGASELDAESAYHHEPDDGQRTESFTVNAEGTEGEATIPVIAEDVYGEEKIVEATVDLDTASPTYDSASKVDDATIQVTLSDSSSGLAPSTIEQGDFSVSDGSISGIDAAGIESGDDTGTVTINLDGAVDTSSVDVSIVGSIEDDAGNELTEGSESVSDMDSVAPTLDDATKSSDTEIDVTVSDGVDVDESTIESSDFSLSAGTVDSIATSENGGTTTVTVTLTEPVDTSEIDVSIASGETIADTSGNQLDDSASPVTASNMDGVSPSISSVTLANDGGNLQFSFDSDEQLGSDASDVTVSVDGPSTTDAYTFDRSDFTESTIEDGYTYTLSTTQAYDDGDGQYTASVDDAMDAAGNNGGQNSDGEGLTASYSLDTTSPSMSLSSPSSGATTSDNQPVITADVTDDGSGVDANTISVTVADSESDGLELDGVSPGQSGVSYDSGTLTIDLSSDGADVTLADGQVDVTVDVTDNDGNSGSPVDSFTVDTTNPTVNNFAPADGATVSSISNNEITFDVSDATSDVDTSTLSVTVSDTEGEKVSATGVDSSDALTYDSGTVTVDVSGVSLADGDVTVDANVDDATGNNGQGSATFTLDTASPSVSNVAAIDDDDGDEYVSSGDTVSVSAEVTDGTSGVDSVSVDATALGGPSDVTLSQVGDTDTYSGTFVVGGSGDITAEDGDVSLTVTAADAASNEQIGSDTITLDTTVEATSLTASDAGSQNVDVTVQSNEQLSDLTVSLSGAESAELTGVGADFTETSNDDGSYTYTATYEGSSDGDYTVSLTSASDTNGNTDTSTGLSDTATIDTTSPSMSLSSPSSGAMTNDNQPTITVDVTEDGSGVDTSTLSVTVADSNTGDNEELAGVGTDQTGVSYDAETGTLTIDLSSDGADITLADGQVDVDVNVDDNKENSGSLSDSFTVDTDSVSAQIGSPSDGDTVQSQNSITGTATDDNEVSSVELTIENSAGDTWDGSSFTETPSTVLATADDGSFDSDSETWTYDGSLPSTDGDYTVTATATDAAGNTGDSSAVSYTIDSTQPSMDSAVTADTDGNGQIDQITVTFSEEVTGIETADYSVDSHTISGIASTGTDTVTFNLQESGSSDTDATPTVSYSDDGSGSSTQDTAGNALPDGESVTADDGTAASMTDAAGTDGSNTVTVTFSEGVGTNADGSGALSASDFTWVNNDGDSTSKTVDSVSHTAGSNTAELTLSGSVDSSDLSSDEVQLDSTVYDSAGNGGASGTTVVVK